MDEADRKLLDEELRRCDLLSVEPPLVIKWEPGVGYTRDAQYYAERARVLRKIDPRRAVEFLRTDALDALAGQRPTGARRWWQLHDLEFQSTYAHMQPGEIINELSRRAGLPPGSAWANWSA